MRRAIFRQKLFGSFADVGNCAYARYDFGEAVRQDGIIEDDGCSGGLESFDGAHECGPRLRTQRQTRGVAIGRGLRWGLRGGDALEGNARAGEDEGRYSEAFATECIAMQVVRVRAGLRLLRRSNSRRVGGVFARHYGECDGSVGDIPRDGSSVIEQPVEWRDAGDAYQATGGKDADHGAGCGGHADGVASIGAVAEEG